MSTAPPPKLQIVRWQETASPRGLLPALEAILFQTAATKTFPSPEDESAFRQRWLGRYLDHDAALVWLALAPAGEVAGYLVGCLDDPACTARFSDLPYFRAFAALTTRFPAHLHVNLADGWRSAGTGSRLLSAFCRSAAQAGITGVHVVTGAGMRNVGFYARNGFAEVAQTDWNGKQVVMLGRLLGPQ